MRHTEKAHTQTAHFVFDDQKANAEKPKELFFANAWNEIWTTVPVLKMKSLILQLSPKDEILMENTKCIK